MITTLTGRNQITIPARLAARFSLKPGTRIEWLPGERPDEIRCRIVPDPARLASELKGAGRRYLQPGRPHPLALLAEEREAEETTNPRVQESSEAPPQTEDKRLTLTGTVI